MQKRTVCVLLVCLLLLGAAAGLAHSGRTDSSGGHKDNKNASGLGSYHYHCGGHPPHLHNGGVCPYAAGSSATAKPAATAKPTAAPTAKPAAQPTLSVITNNAAPAAADDGSRYGLTNIKGVNVRAKASTDAKKLHSFALTGSAVIIVDEVVGSDDEVWYQIDLNGEPGFILGKYIDEVAWEAYAAGM